MEKWKEIPGFEGYYEASDLGRIRRMKNKTIYKDGRIAHFSETILNPGKNKKGYLVVYLSIKSKKHTITVHKLIAKTFIENPENKKTVNHKDLNKENNHIKNLEWATNLENMQHAFENGVFKSRDKKTIKNLGVYSNGLRGEKNPSSKVNLDIVKEIKSLKGIMSGKRIAELYNVSESTVSAILNNKYWND
jgi:hypothetical protein